VNDTSYDLVIPTIGRESLWTLLHALRWMPEPKPEHIVVVDDRASCAGPLWLYADALGDLAGRTRVVRSGGRGPAATRNAGWRTGHAPWVVFVDDDVVPTGMWTSALQRDLVRLPPHVAASQGQITVPLPRDRRPTDRERTVARIAGAPWITADMAVRRSVLEHIGGFDERFPRAYREDSDLALRILDAGWELTYGTRAAVHLTSPASGWISIPQQAGNADDALMRQLHGPAWRQRIGAARGRLRIHVLTVAAAAVAAGGLAAGAWPLASIGGAVWTASTVVFFAQRSWDGPTDARTLGTMLATSAVIPFAAVWHRLAGTWRWRHVRRAADVGVPAAVLLDRDGTLIADVPHNADPARVRPLPGAREGVARLRAAGISIAVVTNQAGLAEGKPSHADFEAVNRRIEEMLGPLGPWCVCPHAERDGCGCRKPAAGLIRQAAAALGVSASACVVIGDTEADLAAADAVGARGILVPNARTRRDEIARAKEVAPTVDAAVRLVLGRPWVQSQEELSA
jgi:HAD superfamily hydrolase (TIGR01662 family)